MNISAQRLAHLPPSDIGNGMKCKTIEKLVMVHEILPYAIHNKMEEFVLFMKEQCHGQVSYLLLRVSGGRDQIHGLEVPKVDIPAQNIDVEQFADVLLPLIAVQVPISELLSYIG